MATEADRLTPLDSFVSKDAPICYGILIPGNNHEGGVPVVKVKNIIGGSINESTILLTSPEIHKQYKRSELNQGDLLLTIRGSTGRVALVPNSLAGANITQDTARIRVSTDDSAEYLYYALQSPMTQRQIELNTVGQAVKGINIAEVKKLLIFHPNKAIQTKIAQILSTWDKAIATTERLLANSQQQKQALMQQLLTGQKRFAEFRDQWNHQQLGDIATIVMGSSPRSESYNGNGLGLPLLQGNADIDNRRSSPRIFTSQITKECNPGDILLSVRAPVGHVALSAHHACIGRGIAGLLAHKEHDQSFLYQWLIWFEPQWESISQGSTFESVNSNDIRSLKVMTPPLPEQQKIAQVLSTADAELTNLQAQLAKLKLEKKALMQQLLTGQRRVKLDADAAA